MLDHIIGFNINTAPLTYDDKWRKHPFIVLATKWEFSSTHSMAQGSLPRGWRRPCCTRSSHINQLKTVLHRCPHRPTQGRQCLIKTLVPAGRRHSEGRGRWVSVSSHHRSARATQQNLVLNKTKTNKDSSQVILGCAKLTKLSTATPPRSVASTCLQVRASRLSMLSVPHRV